MARSLTRSIVGLATVAVLAGPAAPRADAQYFGRNKVQYEDFDFQVLRTEHFDIYHYVREAGAIELAARMAERWYQRLSTVLAHEFHDRQPLILYAAHPHFRQTNVIQGMVGPGTGGVTEPFKRRIVLPFAGPLAETDHVIGHEIVHAFQYDMLGGSLTQLPLWFVEGMAEYLSVGPVDPHTAMWLRDAMAHDRLPDVGQLSSPDYFPYRFGHAFWAYVSGVAGDSIVRHVFKQGRRGAREALRTIFDVPADTLARAWHDAVRAAYEPVQAATEPPDRFARRLISEANAGEVSLAPALSPNGSRIAFLSEKSLVGIELYIADVETGEIRRKLVETAIDPHFESLAFINSAGTWSPDGARFAFAGVSGGQPIITIVRVHDGKTVRELKFPELGEVLNPAWSPDGRFMAFTGQRAGMLDLYRYDLERNALARLTDDPWSELHPAWSPDGSTIAFATERFGADLARLSYGNYRLALLEVSSGEIRPVPGLPDGKHINPQWTPDGQGLYFLADHGAITNVHRLDLRSGQIDQLTNLLTGATGITALSPALSVSAESGHVAFTAFRDGGYEIYHAEASELVAVDPADRQLAAAALPPGPRRGAEMLAWLARPERGLPPDTVYALDEYTPTLSLDYIAQPSVLVGADQFGAFIGGGSAVFFSDMLGQHRVGTMLQVNGSLDNLTAAALYQNQDHRFIWGGLVQRVPLLTTRFAEGLAEVDGDTAIILQQEIFRQTNYRAAATGSYPFSRVLRLDLSAGFERFTFGRERRTTAIDPRTGRVLFEEAADTSLFEPMHMGIGSAALVYDNAYFGPTSPIQGRRYRFEAAPAFGSLEYMDALADMRQYWMPVQPLTIAVRLLHFGRYGADADDERIRQLFLGAPGLVRGFDPGSFDPQDCEPTRGDPCPAFSQLLGSRVAVANAELRFPLLRVLNVGEGPYGAFPLELAFFADAGLAWRSDAADTGLDERAFFLGGDREPVASAGATLRANLGGVIILGATLAHAFDRNDWVTQLTFSPGF